MPGSRKSETERRLLGQWQQGGGYDYPNLREIEISADPPLRGIRSLKCQFRYPVTVLVGKNGSGKTTVLSLAMLGFHSPTGHYPLNAGRAQQPTDTKSWYTFRDFFITGPGDPTINGVNIRWNFGGDPPDLSISKKSAKWVHYDRRPERPVHYFGLINNIPSSEQSVLRNYANQFVPVSGDVLSPEYVQRLGNILGRNYDGADRLAYSKYSINTCQSEFEYSAFNMGGAEGKLIKLLFLLQEVHPGTLIGIEEIETNLYPEASASLARHIQEVAYEKKLQIIITSHDRHFIDQLPRESRAYLRQASEEHTVIYEPTTTFAMGLIGEPTSPELRIYCEDKFAETLILMSLNASQRNRVHILPIGSKTELGKPVYYHLKSNLNARALVVWDGDVTSTEMRQYLADAKLDPDTTDLSPGQLGRLNVVRIPGPQPPEKWVVDVLNSPRGFEVLQDEASMDEAEAEGLVHRLTTVMDVHDVGYEAAKFLGLDISTAVNLLCRSARRVAEAEGELAVLRSGIARILQGETVRDDRDLVPAEAGGGSASVEDK